MICANHPNSFLDAVLLDTLFQQPIWSLARGDVFRGDFLTRLLTSIRILPVYRVSEGVENLSSNYETFSACKDIFRRNGVVLIFSEGLCINEWHLRPLKKGTARLALSSWKDGIDLQILPLGLNYSSFKSFGKDVVINIGTPISLSNFNLSGSEGQQLQQFNTVLTKNLESLVFEIEENDTARQKRLISPPSSPARKLFFALPGLAGWVLHLPLYLPAKLIARKTVATGHYDSILAALLFLAYPGYLLLMAVLLLILTGKAINMLFFIVLPITAYSFIQSGLSAGNKL